MALLIGVTLALAVSLFASLTGLDRDRGFYPVMLIVTASCYGLFAVMGGSAQVFSLESLAMTVFVAASVVGFKTSLWLVVTAFVGHGLFDLVHGRLVANPGTPQWWPEFCLGYDVMAAFYLGCLLTRPHAIRSAETSTRVPSLELQLTIAGELAAQGEAQQGFAYLERAHILAQNSTSQHVRVHWHMLRWAVRQRDGREFLGQLLRIAGAAGLTGLGLVPRGNTGGANMSPFRSMPVPADLTALVAPPRSVRQPRHS